MAYNTSRGPRTFGDVTSEGNVSGSGTLEIVGNTFLGGALEISGAVTHAGSTAFTSISGSGTLEMVGATYLGNTLNVTGAISGSNALSAVGAITTAGGLNLQKSGITNAGAIAGATNISGSGTLQSVGATTFGSTLNVSGNVTIKAATTLSGAAVTATTLAGTSIALQNGGISSAGSISGVRGLTALTDLDIGNYDFRAKSFTSDVTTGTAPLTISSTTKVANLNVDQLDGNDWTAPGAIGATTPGAAQFTTISGSSTLQAVGNAFFGGTLNVTGASTFVGVATHTAHPIFNSGITIKNADASAGYINFFEQSSNGTNVCTFRGKSSMGNITITLPGDTGTVVLEDNTVTLSNKTIASPTITGDLTATGDTNTFSSANSTDPLVIIKNTTNDANGARLRFVKDKGAAGADGDDIGIIEFVGDDAAQTQTTFAKIVAEVSEADNTDEAGKLTFYVAESDGTTTTLTAGLVLEGEHATDGEVDVTIGAGATSLTTIAGDLDIPNGGFALGSDASGDMYYRNSSGVLTRIGVGSDNHVLTLDGAVPGWETAPAASSIAADDITAGDAAVSISTTSGNVTVDSNAGTTTIDGHTGVTIQSSNSGEVDITSAANIDVNATTDISISGSALDVDVAGTLAIDSTYGSITLGAILADGQTLKLGKNGAVETIIAPHGTTGSEKYSVINTAGITDGSDAAGAILLSSVAGGIGLAWADGKDLWAEGGRAVITANEDAADCIKLHADAGTSQTITVVNDAGTSVTEGSAAVSVQSLAGGVELRSTANLANAINITNDGGASGTITIFNDQGTSVTEGAASIQLLTDAGGIGIKSTANLAEAILLTTDGGTSETIKVHADQSEVDGVAGAGAIALISDAGGIGLSWADGKDLWAEGGRAVITANEDAADCIKLHADAGTSQTITVVNDAGTGAAAVGITSTAGGVTISGDTDHGVIVGNISGGPVTIGHATSETTVSDNLTVTGNTTATGDVTLGAAGNTTATAITTIVNTGTTVGKDLTVAAGSSTTGGNNINGGNLILTSGGGDGTGTSIIQFKTKVDGTDATAERMRIADTGFVGIGETVPKTALSVTHDYATTTFETQLTDGQGGGRIMKYSPGADDTLTVGQLYFLHTDGTWDACDADAVATGGSQLLGVGLGEARTVGVLLEGFIRIPSTEILNTPGSGATDGLPLYVSTTAGHFDFTAPSAAGDFVRVVGYAIDDDSSDVLIYFDPDKTWVEM